MIAKHLAAPLSAELLPGGITELDLVRRLHELGQPALTLAQFTAAAWQTIEPSTELIWSWHLDVLCEHVQAQLEGGKFGKPWAQNVIYNVPPGTMKSIIVSVMAPAWKWLWVPGWRAICTSANPRVALRDSVKCRDVITSAWYLDTFKPKWRLADDQNAKGYFKNSSGGFRLSLGAGAAITGDRADSILHDDLLDAAEAHSKASREAINNWLDQAAGNRLNDLKRGTRSIIGQRLHEEDPPGHLLTTDPLNWHHVRLPMEGDTRPECKCPDCTKGETFLGFKDTRKEGELLFPERFPIEVLRAEKVRLGSAGYAGQMQQRPTPASGNMYQRSWWRFWSLSPGALARPRGATDLPPLVIKYGQPFDITIQSWDCAFKELDSSDFVCGGVVARWGGRRIVLDLFWDHAGFMKTIDAVLEMRRKWPRASSIKIEDKANGTAVIEVLKSRITGVDAIEPEGGKEARAAATLPIVEAGDVYLPEGAPWLERWFDEFGAFPNGKHDDAVDMLSQALRALSDGGGMWRAAALLGFT